jgi:predicted DNA-binding antitoxin AbrB/MazE fold protein
MRVLDGVIDENGAVKLLEPADLPKGQRVVVTVLEGPPKSHSLSRLEGYFDWTGPPATIEDMNRAIEEGAAGL